MSTSYRRPPDIAVLAEDEPASRGDGAVRVHVAPLPEGPLCTLEGHAALIWYEALAGGGAREIAGRLAEALGLDVVQIEGDVADFLADLVDRGLLVRDLGAG